jgi:hypothetical protein
VFFAFHKKLRRLTYVLVAAIVLINIYRLILYFGFHAREKWLIYSFDTRADKHPHRLPAGRSPETRRRNVVLELDYSPYLVFTRSVLTDDRLHCDLVPSRSCVQVFRRFRPGPAADSDLAGAGYRPRTLKGLRLAELEGDCLFGKNFLWHVSLPHACQPPGDRALRNALTVVSPSGGDCDVGALRYSLVLLD